MQLFFTIVKYHIANINLKCVKQKLGKVCILQPKKCQSFHSTKISDITTACDAIWGITNQLFNLAKNR